MSSGRRDLRKAGVSEVIATILLISVSLGLGFFLWFITSGVAQGISQFSAKDTDAQIQQARTSVIAAYTAKGSPTVIVYVFNNGRIPVKIIGIDLIGANNECIPDTENKWSCLALPKDFETKSFESWEPLEEGELSDPITISFGAGQTLTAITIHAVSQKIFEELDVSFVFTYEVTATSALA